MSYSTKKRKYKKTKVHKNENGIFYECVDGNFYDNEKMALQIEESKTETLQELKKKIDETQSGNPLSSTYLLLEEVNKHIDKLEEENKRLQAQIDILLNMYVNLVIRK